MKNNLFYAQNNTKKQRIENLYIDFESMFYDSFYQYFVFFVVIRIVFGQKSITKSLFVLNQPIPIRAVICGKYAF